MRLRRSCRWLWLLLVTMLFGCTSGSYAPVSDRHVVTAAAPRIYSYRQVNTSTPGVYRVQMGDTLYSIAFRYGKDYKALARANNIDSSYRIYPGQSIRLTEAAAPTPAPAPRKTTPPATARKAQPKKPISQPRPQSAPKSSGSKVAWAWPVKGRVIQGFSDKGVINKGLNIAASEGTPVHAAADGEIVYAGSGLLGYGNLIIIKHSSQYLSAYAHNSRLLVKEKEQVKQGEKIAEVGDSGTVRSMLHFEVRKDGKPVNPMLYLP